MKPLIVYRPDDLRSSDMPDLSSAAWRFLAKGDSWFSIGAFNPAKCSNLLFEMAFKQLACAINCARPGDTLAHMVDLHDDPEFVDLLCGARAREWDALLLSCGGNDLIDAVATPTEGVPRDLRLLLAEPEWGASSMGVARYLSEEGWSTFSNYLQSNLAELIALRDRGPSARCPMFVHGYAFPTPRDAGAGLGLGPWLHPSLTTCRIPELDWQAVGELLMRRLSGLLAASAADGERFPNLHFFDTTMLPLDPAEPGAAGESGDWYNEIHLTWRGYEKLAMPWAGFIEQTLNERHLPVQPVE